MMRGGRSGAGRAGFSAIELMFAAALLTAVGGATFTLLYANEFGADLSGDQSAAMSDAQTALRNIAADLQPGTAFSVPANTGGVRVTPPSGAPIEYYQSGTTLYRLVAGAGSPALPVVTGLAAGSGFLLKYYDSSMSTIAAPMDSTKYGQAAAVDVAVTIDLAHSSFGQVSRTTRVVLRNRVN